MKKQLRVVTFRGALLCGLVLICIGCRQAESGFEAEGNMFVGVATATRGATLNPALPAATRSAKPAIWYIRTDGGSPQQCSGLVDAPYPGTGVDQPCAWDHPFRSFPPGGEARIQGGDTLIIGPGSYMMGYGAPDDAGVCDAAYPWDCAMSPVPSSLSQEQPTRILGAGWDAGCEAPPELWGSERVVWVFNLAGSSNVEVACLEISDHAGCAEDHSGSLACPRGEPPYGPWAQTGLVAWDSSNVTLRQVNIHGLGAAGIRAGRLRDWYVEDLRLAGNGWVGWDGDLGEKSWNDGTLIFERWLVEWNGCVETWPEQEMAGCWAQTAGGYGDGIGTAETGGYWIIRNSIFRYNTSDGLDMFYNRPGARVELVNVQSYGNAGDQVKISGPAVIENLLAVSYCGFFDNQPFTYHVDACRAGGSALALTLWPGDSVSVTHATLAGQGDCLMIAECAEGENCDGTEGVQVRNSIFVGGEEYGGDDTTCLYWYGEGGLDGRDPFDLDYSLIYNTKDTPPCPGEHNLCAVNPGLADLSLSTFDAHLLPDSPAIDAGASDFGLAFDLAGNPRAAQPDMGAYEFGAAEVLWVWGVALGLAWVGRKFLIDSLPN